jgi:hypothetical protein
MLGQYKGVYRMRAEWTDAELSDEMFDIDTDESIVLTDWEVEFVDQVVLRPRKFGFELSLTKTQRAKCLEIMEKYRG